MRYRFILKKGPLAGIISVSLALLSLLIHAIPFFRSSHPLGYDTGFYRRYLIEPFLSFPNTPVPGLGSDAVLPRMLLDILRFTHLSPDMLLYGSYIAFFAALPVLFFFYLKKTLSVRIATLASTLLIFSSVQYTEYWYMLWKNSWALCLLFLAFIFLEKRYFYGALFLDIAIALSHKTSALIYITTLAMLFFFWKARRLEMLVHAVVTSLCLIGVALPAIHAVTVSLPVAVFLDWSTYFRLSFPLLLVSALGLFPFRSKNYPPTLLAFAFVSFFFVLFHLPFYERVFVFSDIALIAFAADAIGNIVSRWRLSSFNGKKIAYGAALCVVLGLFLGNWWGQGRTLLPLESGGDLDRIVAIGNLVPQEATLLTTSDEAPWYEGWTQSHIAAPGMLHDTHDLEKWIAFWSATSTAERIGFLNDFKKPLYISSLRSTNDLIGSPISCVKEISPNLWQDTCQVD